MSDSGYRRLTRRTIRYGDDRECLVRVRFPAGLDSARNRLVDLLSVVVGEDDLANEIVAALDVYLEDGPGRTAQGLGDFTPNYKSEVEKARAERDAAIACAEQALGQMQATLDALRGGTEIEDPEKTNGRAAQPLRSGAG